MFKPIQVVLIKALAFSLALYPVYGSAQGNMAEKAEREARLWGSGMQQAQLTLGVSAEEFGLFTRFYGDKIDTMRARFFRNAELSNGNVLSANDKLNLEVNQLVALYGQFQQVEKDYPSSVDEYRKHNMHKLTNVCDTAGCDNIGFEQGTLNGWNAYYAFNNNQSGTYSYFNLTNVTGGPAGAVTQAANDVLTSTSGFYNVGVGPNPSPDYQVTITSGTGTDGLVPAIPVVSPVGGSYSVLLGDTTLANYGVAILSKTFEVKPGSTDFTYQYAVVLENPLAHTYYEQPFFQVAILDQNGDTIPLCGQYSVVSSGGQAAGFTSVYVPPHGFVGNDTAYYKNWTVVCVPLKKYIGQCVTIIFEAGDCSLGGHFGYAYVDASCSPLQITASSMGLCGHKYITLDGPPGFTQYIWSGPANSIIGANNTQSIKVDSAGTYQLIAIPVTGIACSDTLTITIANTPGPAPVPSFTFSNPCVGQPVQFTNTSVPLAGAGVKFYWDFYNLGTIQDSSLNPSWVYNTPGVYYVHLYEVNNGCGSDTIIPITVIAPPVVHLAGPFKVCEGDTITLTASVISSYLPYCFYNWNTGANTRSIQIVATPGDTSYYVTVTSGCTDTARWNLNIINTKPLHVCCDTTMQAGDTANIGAWGEKSYVWSPPDNLSCATCANSMAYPRQTTTYTCTAVDSNGCVFKDTLTIHIENCPDVFIPKAFTPNANGLNDYFYPQGRCLESYSMYIFDRWGNLIYKSPSGVPWDGRVGGKKVMEDTYVYQIIATTWDGNTRTIIGAVTVLK
jgi:gliding motility-associated-like protein